MKKLVSILLAIVMLCTLAPMTAFARNSYIMYDPTDSCQMTSISFTQADNAWLLWDVNFVKANGDTVLKTEKDHPSLVGCKVIPNIQYNGTSVTFNGQKVVEGETVTLKAENEIVVEDSVNHNFAEYTVFVTEKSNGLPSVLIDTDGADIPDKLNYVDASISVIGSSVYGAKDIYSAVAGIKLRGNSTMSYAKKPYRIKFDKKQDVLGLGKAKSWVLLADYLDPSGLRNQVAFNLATRINKFTSETTGFQVFAPRMKLVEVYLNGEFKGLYEMGDHMQANELRVDISEWGDEDPTAPGEDVGYFIEVEVKDRVLKEGADGYEDWSDYSYIVDVDTDGKTAQKINDKDTENGYVIREDDMGKSVIYFQFKLPEKPSDEQKSYITEQMQQVNDLLMKGDDAVWDIFDMDSVIDWYLVNELFKNADSQMQSSVYFFKNGLKDSDGNLYETPNTKLYMGPVWDFDLGAGGVAYGSMDDPTGWRTSNDEYCAWFREMFKMDSFKDAVNTRWANLHSEGILEAMYTDIDSLKEFAGDAAVESFDLWHNTYLNEIDGTWMTVPAVSTGSNEWETHVDYFESYLKARIDWMDEQFGYTEETVLGTQLDAVDSITFTAPSTGEVSKTYPINESLTVDQLGFSLDMTSDTAWDFGFDFTVNATINGKNATINLTPSAKNDWKGSGNVFDGTTREYIAAGTYNDRVMTVSGALKWHIATYYLGGVSSSTVDLSKYVTSIKLNSVTVTFENATKGNTATFSLTNTGTNKTALKYEKPILTGKPSIMGVAVPGMTLFASNTEILPYKATVTYQWYADGSAISGATGNSYKMTTSDLGKAITVKATANGYYYGTVTSDAKTVEKYPRTSTYKSSEIELIEVTTNSFTVSTIYSGVEYSLDCQTWQSEPTFTDLEANTVYTVYMRAGEHGTGAPGVASDPLYVLTKADENTVKGDVNGSGKLDTTDAVWVLDQALDFAQMNNETALALSDFNDDGRINTLDVRLLLKAIVNTP